MAIFNRPSTERDRGTNLRENTDLFYRVKARLGRRA